MTQLEHRHFAMGLAFLAFCLWLPVSALASGEASPTAPSPQDSPSAKPETTVTIEDVKRDPVAHRGKTVELSGQVRGTIKSAANKTFILRLKSGENLFLIADPDSPDVELATDRRALALVPQDAARITELRLLKWVPIAVKEAPAAPAVAEAPLALVEGNAGVEQAAREAFHSELRVRVLDFTAKGASSAAAAPTRPAAKPVSPQGFGQRKASLPSRGLSGPEDEVSRLKPAYKRTIRYFNKNLPEAWLDYIAGVLLQCSIEEGLDPRLVVAVIAVESGFRLDALSPKGAMGLGQLMPGTAAGMGVSNAFDPGQNIRACIRILRGHFQRYASRPDQFNLALSAYNAGGGAVRRHGGVPPYRETVNYIWKVYNLYRSMAPEVFR